MKKKRILLADDDESFRRVLEHNLTEQGYEVVTASDGNEALSIFESWQESYDRLPELVITDIKMPRMNGMELLAEIKRRDPDALVIVITAFAEVETAVEAMKSGAYDYITKPVNREELRLIVQKAFELKSLISENLRLHQQLADKFSFEGIIGGSSRMQKVFATVARVAQSDSTVLIQGESGTGKELIAKAIHFNSNRAKKNFVAVNCSAIPENLLESELFGHKKGAFTGADSDRRGKFELADGGTIFLDEITDLRSDLQSKLLRVLQEKTIDKIGEESPLRVDVRVIAATNQSIEEVVKSGNFREDLYYRISVIPILLPPLRERKDDIPLLVQNFLQKNNAASCTVEATVFEAFQKYNWPGNVRELENVIERALVLREHEERITINDIPEHIRTFVQTDAIPHSLEIPDEGINLEDVEKNLIINALKKAQWNQTKAAELLSITRQTLIYRMQKYDISPDIHRNET